MVTQHVVSVESSSFTVLYCDLFDELEGYHASQRTNFESSSLAHRKIDLSPSVIYY